MANTDPCKGIDCSGHGSCVLLDGEPLCMCDSGYHAAGLACVENRGNCEGVKCDNPPARHCVDQDTLRVYQSPGTCLDRECHYDFQDTTCPEGCLDGVCIAVPHDCRFDWATEVLGTGQGWGISAQPDGSALVAGNINDYVIFGLGEPNEARVTKDGTESFVARYNPDGTFDWVVTAGGTHNDRMHAMDARPDGSFAITGDFGNTAVFGAGDPNETHLTAGGDWDGYIASYAPGGTLKWAQRVSGGYWNCGHDVSLLSDGSVIATGRFNGDGILDPSGPNETLFEGEGDTDIYIAKYTNEGSLAWARSAGGQGSDNAQDLLVLPDGSFILAGQFGGFDGFPATFGRGEDNQTVLNSNGMGDVFIARYEPDGKLTWAKSVGSRNWDGVSGIALLDDDSFITSGEFTEQITFGEGEPTETTLSSVAGPDSFVACFRLDGAFLWAIEEGGELGTIEIIDIAAFPGSSFVTAGSFRDSVTLGVGEPNETVLTATGGSDVLLSLYGSDTSLLSASRAGGTNPEYGAFGGAVSVLADGTVYVTGGYVIDLICGPGETAETVFDQGAGWHLFVMRLSCQAKP
jgi:hypothetical protein